MSPTLIPIYGSWGIQAYGLFIAIGAALATFLAIKDPRRIGLFTKENVINILSWSIIIATLGGWLLSVATQWPTTIEDLFNAGFSVLGSIIAVFLFLLIYVRRLGVPLLPALDFCGSFAPLVQAFGRIGCFFAGCCYGLPTTVFWATQYTDPESRAPLNSLLHPAQLYSASLLFLIFFFLRYQAQKKHTPGSIISSYLLLAGLERFITDFFREDHGSGWVSTHQLIALSVSCIGFVWLVYIRNNNER
jgi:phosphatidylglycerol:prolipoprotein diacylglycerol transferase